MPYNNPNHCKYLCTVFSGILVLLISFISIPTAVYPYFNALTFEETQCYINKIDYPYDLPTLDNYENWAKCDCGRRCQSYSPCINLFTNSQQTTINSLQTNIDSQQTTIDSLQTNIDSQQTTIDSQQTTIDSLQTTIDSQQTTIDSQQTIIATLETQVADLLSKVTALENP